MISSKAELFRRLAKLTLKLPKDEFIIAGSAPLLLRGIRPCSGDIDVVVKPSSWSKVEKLGATTIAEYSSARMIYLDESQVQLLDRWFYPELWKDFDDLSLSTEPERGYHFLTLESTLAWKEYTKREKDLEDITFIARYITEHEAPVVVPAGRRSRH